MAGYKLATYQSADGPRAGVIVDDTLFDAAKLTRKAAYATVVAILEDWKNAQALLKKAAVGAAKANGAKGGGRPLKAPSSWLPCAGPRRSIVQVRTTPTMRRDGRAPGQGTRTRSAHAGPAVLAFHQSLALARQSGRDGQDSDYSKQMDWEVELAAVIGRPAKNVPIEKALGYVAGYTCANDLSARDRGRRPHISETSPFKPTGWRTELRRLLPARPWIVPASEIKDPQGLALKLLVNDVLKQDSHTSKMIFTLAEQISHLSSRLTLHPGDLVLTGTPAGVGAGRGEFLKAGDVVKIWIEKIGEISNKMA